MQPAIAIANFFLQESFDSGHSMNCRKLVVLTYIAHGWHLGIAEQPLVCESVEAWQMGPIFPSIYHQFKSQEHITNFATDYDGQHFFVPITKESDKQLLLRKVWAVYKQYSDVQLFKMCQKEGTPWQTTWENRDHEDQVAVVISNNTILSYYKQQLGSS